MIPTGKAILLWLRPKARSTAANSASRPRTSSGCCDSASRSGLTFDDMGKRRNGIPSTLHFCDELFRLYGSDDYNQAMGAAFAVENWAAAGFWKELIAGLERMKATKVPDMPLAFFTWHDKIEGTAQGARLGRAARVLRVVQVPRGAVHYGRREDARRRQGVLGWTWTRSGGGGESSLRR